jgi:GNAT superfamily N-acetyltransferase
MSTTIEPRIVDLSLARRLERAEALANAEFVEARAKAFPDLGAEWIEVAGAYAMFDGVDSPCTQTFGLGMFDEVTDAHLDEIERFFRDRGAKVFHEVCPLIDEALVQRLNERGYRAVEFSNVMYRPIQQGEPLNLARNESIQTRIAGRGEEGLWAHTAALGWQDVAPQFFDFILDLAELDGQAIAAGAMGLFEGTAQFAGACTIPAWRNQGAQLALLDARLRYAAEHGCDIAMMVARPGSASQRNAQRQGFHIAYTRAKWSLSA